MSFGIRYLGGAIADFMAAYPDLKVELLLNDRFIDLRIDDHPQPINELKRILQLHKLYLFPPDPADILVIDHDIARELQQLLTVLGDYQGAINGSYDEVTRAAFRKFSGRENLEERWFEDARVDRTVLEFLRQKANR